MEQYFDWWDYLIIALLPGAGFMFGVAWARREFRAGRDPMLTSESWWQRRRRRHEVAAGIERLESQIADIRQELRVTRRARGLTVDADYRIPTPV